MRKLFFVLLCFLSLSIHARLEVSFKVTGSEAKYLKVCLGNEHSSGKHVCGMGSAARHYDNKDITAQIIYAEWTKHNNHKVVWYAPFPKGLNVLPKSTSKAFKRGMPDNSLVYNPLGRNGLVSITAKSRVTYKKVHLMDGRIIDMTHIDLYDIQIKDNSK